MSKKSYYDTYSETSEKVYADILSEIELALNKSNGKTPAKRFKDYHDWYYYRVWKEFPETTSVFRKRLYERFVSCKKSKNDFINPNDFIDDFIKTYWKDIVDKHKDKLEEELEKKLSLSEIATVKYLAKCSVIDRFLNDLESIEVVLNDTSHTIMARLRNIGNEAENGEVKCCDDGLKNITVKAIALFYYYMQKSRHKDYPNFGSVDGKIKEIKAVSEKYEISSKSFELAYNEISIHENIRISKNQIKNIEICIEMLSESPDAKKLALFELEKAKALLNL